MRKDIPTPAAASFAGQLAPAWDCWSARGTSGTDAGRRWPWRRQLLPSSCPRRSAWTNYPCSTWARPFRARHFWPRPPGRWCIWPTWSALTWTMPPFRIFAGGCPWCVGGRRRAFPPPLAARAPLSTWWWASESVGGSWRRMMMRRRMRTGWRWRQRRSRGEARTALCRSCSSRTWVGSGHPDFCQRLLLLTCVRASAQWT